MRQAKRKREALADPSLEGLSNKERKAELRRRAAAERSRKQEAGIEVLDGVGEGVGLGGDDDDESDGGSGGGARTSHAVITL